MRRILGHPSAHSLDWRNKRKKGPSSMLNISYFLKERGICCLTDSTREKKKFTKERRAVYQNVVYLKEFPQRRTVSRNYKAYDRDLPKIPSKNCIYLVLNVVFHVYPTVKKPRHFTKSTQYMRFKVRMSADNFVERTKDSSRIIIKEPKLQG